MKTKTLIFSLFFVSILASSIFFIQDVNAVSYYNWIQNPSFTTYTNYCEDGSFESGLTESGLVYGNWSNGNGEYDMNYPKTGIYCYYMDANEYVWYNLTSPYSEVLGADITEFSFYGQYFVNKGLDVTVYYNDASTSVFDTESQDGDYPKIDFTDNINDAKYVVAFYFSRGESGGYDYCIDDVVLLVDDGEGQDDITGTSEPWFADSTIIIIGDAIRAGVYYGMNTTYGRLDDNSGFIQWYDTSLLSQNINFLYAGNVHFIDTYVYSESSVPVYIRCIVIYTDGSYSTKVVLYDADSTWAHINFGKSFLDEEKLIYRIYFGIDEGSHGIADWSPLTGGSDNYQEEYPYQVLFDDCGLWADVPYSYSKFDFVLSPMYNRRNGFQFYVYTETQYTMTGYFYNSTGYLNDDGTVTITDSEGTQEVDMESGIFTYIINKRSYTNTYTQEYILLQVLTNDDELVLIQLRATFEYLSGGVTDDSGTEISDIDGDFLANWFIYAIFLVVIPIAMTGYISNMGQQPSPTLMLVTFLGSETLMSAISLSIGLVDIWFMLVVIIVDVLLILGLMKNRG